ncbi:general secretion pathway protein GspB [Gilvimarinus agarilyticus]|uniref:general secretion pathway protein GspB n=1 Tax=Gilvimarinus agarilyticus TaxID=679259 RepID=UPI0005A10635|nr:general secretion pathway protein GspB [Gilvimarinus agarilyticus]
MSLILDALRKADRERQQQHNGVPGIDATHPSGPERPRKLWPWLVALALLVSVLLIVVIWLLLERSSNSVPVAMPAQDPVPSPAQMAPPGKPSATKNVSQPAQGVSAPEPEASNQTQGPQMPSQVVGGVAEDQQKPLATSASASQTESSASSEARVLDDEVARLYSAPPPDEPPVTVAPRPEVTAVNTRSVTPEPAARNSAPPEPELRNSLLAAHPNVGTIRDLPLAVQNEIPTLMYSAHEYREGGVSEVMINNQSLREGQTLQGLELEVIAEDGVIMRSGDHLFKLTAMSSWVNM